MNRDEVWDVIDAERLRLADELGELTTEEWEHPSLCAGWRVKDVAAHVAMVNMSVGRGIAEIIRAGGNMNRMIRESAIREAASLPAEAIVAGIRSLSGVHKPAMSTTHLETLTDTLVHGQDIMIPLGRPYPMPALPAAAAATRMWGRGFPFYPQRRFKGFRLVATDTGWSAGEGREVRGPMSQLLLLITGRPGAVTGLSGEGAADLLAG
ncbi:maleylpyruvate isomerase family mycothiol-dependent enzyme [Nonomuraea sp. NBC_01738]|uniref:maleylpyruvate isomerase family mycothiol-dependent enzyme n=1 Tax=Nonomuraea sp. NBC_01738 TaxID=2976003 RepID=UPI002E149C57|nr:maleylpyruvate isomerase family mycothiol-dependent enzyme [Nonomuraea sp. NBC_01738]